MRRKNLSNRPCHGSKEVGRSSLFRLAADTQTGDDTGPVLQFIEPGLLEETSASYKTTESLRSSKDWKRVPTDQTEL